MILNAQSDEQVARTESLFQQRYLMECKRVDQIVTWLMIAQWFAGIAFAIFYSPFTWIGQHYEIHVHVWAAILLGAAISGFSILWIRLHSESTRSRYGVAICQMLWSALLIHLSGGRIEAHFHVFASLAILSLYRDWRILAMASAVVAIDHFVRGVYYPLSAFGVSAESPYRWIEHTSWVVFEIGFLIPGCMRLRREIRELCAKQIDIEVSKSSVARQVAARTQELVLANQMLAKATQESATLALVARYTDNSVMITDDKTRIEWVNAGFSRITGFELKEVVGKTPSEFLHGPDTNLQRHEEMQTAIGAQKGFDVENILYRKNGEAFWMSTEARPIPDDDGRVTRFIIVENDITVRKTMETSLAATEQQFRSLVNNVPGAFYRCRPSDDPAISFVSSSIEDITGYTPTEFVEPNAIRKFDLVIAEDQPLVQDAMEAAIEHQTDFDIEYRIIDRDHNLKWVSERGQCLLDDDGSLLIDGVIFDITQRRASEAELASQGKVIEDSLNEIFIFDAQSFRIQYVNRGGRENTGYSLEELKQLTPVDLKPKFTHETFADLVSPLVLGHEKLIVFQTDHLRKNGTTYDVEIHLQKSRYQNSDVFLAMVLDISGRVEAEQRNAQLQKELVDASRIAGMAEVATGVLHNVGNILNSVNVSASLIRNQYANSALVNLNKVSNLISEYEDDFATFVKNDNRGQQVPGYIIKVADALTDEQNEIDNEFEDLLKNVQHIKEIVNVQQSMAKSVGLQQKLEPANLVRDAITANKGMLTNHQIEISRVIEPNLPIMVSDKHKILQILVNLIKNAKDSIVEQRTLQPQITVRVSSSDSDIMFDVEDNGTGISSEQLDKIFRHGFTTKKSGHGFGLHSSANTATELGGVLTASSDGPGMGARFRLRIPINPARGQTFAKNESQLASAAEHPC